MLNSELNLIAGALRDTLDTSDELVISLDTDIASDLGLDSILFMHFLLAIEDRVPGLEFDPEIIGQSDFNNVESLAMFIRAFRLREP